MENIVKMTIFYCDARLSIIHWQNEEIKNQQKCQQNIINQSKFVTSFEKKISVSRITLTPLAQKQIIIFTISIFLDGVLDIFKCIFNTRIAYFLAAIVCYLRQNNR